MLFWPNEIRLHSGLRAIFKKTKVAQGGNFRAAFFVWQTVICCRADRTIFVVRRKTK
jgi:hypothetical protein